MKIFSLAWNFLCVTLCSIFMVVNISTVQAQGSQSELSSLVNAIKELCSEPIRGGIGEDSVGGSYHQCVKELTPLFMDKYFNIQESIYIGYDIDRSEATDNPLMVHDIIISNDGNKNLRNLEIKINPLQIFSSNDHKNYCDNHYTGFTISGPHNCQIELHPKDSSSILKLVDPFIVKDNDYMTYEISDLLPNHKVRFQWVGDPCLVSGFEVIVLSDGARIGEIHPVRDEERIDSFKPLLTSSEVTLIQSFGEVYGTSYALCYYYP